jgi:hypothetical protein
MVLLNQNILVQGRHAALQPMTKYDALPPVVAVAKNVFEGKLERVKSCCSVFTELENEIRDEPERRQSSILVARRLSRINAWHFLFLSLVLSSICTSVGSA